MNHQVQEVKGVHYLGVWCQNCGEPIPVPSRVSQQITVERESESAGQYVSTLLNLRCRACHKEYFYDVTQVSEVEGTPRPFATHSGFERPAHHPHPYHARAAHRHRDSQLRDPQNAGESDATHK